MSQVSYKFSIQHPEDDLHTMYAEMRNGTYTKTYMKDGKIISEYIDKQEFASALAFIMLPPTAHKLVPNKLRPPQ